jgi:hypothetical protein
VDPLALYIHWPFCLAKCPYCDFNSHVREAIDQPRFAAALRRELADEAGRLGRRRLTSIFFGGGTPSLMAPATVGALIDDAARWFDPVPGLEITLEANPSSVEAENFAGYRAAGVNRVSLGVQSLDDAALRFLGRLHSAAEAVAALALARRMFPRISFDLIYALQDLDFDRRHGVFSIPARFGPAVGLAAARLGHLLAFALLLSLYFYLHLGPVYLAGVVLTGLLLVYEHSLVSPRDWSRLPVAFFHVNSAVSLVEFVFLAAGLLWVR